MRITTWALGVVALTMASPAWARLTDRDRAGIAAIEQRLAAPPGTPRDTPAAPLTQRMVEIRVPGVSIALIRDGRIAWTRAYGVTVADGLQRVTRRTRFQAASLSKAVAAAGAVRLADSGAISLDEDVNARLRSWRVPVAIGTPVTLRRLLSHTAGLSLSGYPGYAASAGVPTLLQSLQGTPPSNTPAVRAYAAPGSEMAYSGGGYSVAQFAMSEVAGDDFAPLMRRLVLRRAGMRRSSFDQQLSGSKLREVASGHDDKGVAVPGGFHRYPEMAAAGLWTTPSDYARFLIALQNSADGGRRALVTRAGWAAITTPVLADYGLGVSVIARGGRTMIAHNGSNAGFQCRFIAFLDGSREGLVVMTNSDRGGALAAAIQRTLGEAYGWPDPSGPPSRRAPY